MKGNLAVEESLLQVADLRAAVNTDVESRISAMKDRMSKLESVTALKARISTAEVPYSLSLPHCHHFDDHHGARYNTTNRFCDVVVVCTADSVQGSAGGARCSARSAIKK